MTFKKQGIGEVHAPVEDTEVPPSLKLIVFILLVVLIALGTIVMMMANYFGIFSL
jgi:hypothetical protein